MFDFILRNRIKKLCRNSGRTKHFHSLDKIHSVFVVFETSDYDAADAFVERLEKMGKQVKVCCYKVKEDHYDYSETPYRVIVPKIDTDRSGMIQDQVLEELQNGSCDLLIDLTIKENLTMEHLVASLNIPLKVGLKKNDIPLYDLSISKLPDQAQKEASECAELGRQILHYLTTIRSLD